MNLYDTPTRAQLFAEQDEIDAELERDHTRVSEEIQEVLDDLIWWRRQRSRVPSQIEEAVREMNSLHFRLGKLAVECVDIERRQRMPHERVY